MLWQIRTLLVPVLDFILIQTFLNRPRQEVLQLAYGIVPISNTCLNISQRLLQNS